MLLENACAGRGAKECDVEIGNAIIAQEAMLYSLIEHEEFFSRYYL